MRDKSCQKRSNYNEPAGPVLPIMTICLKMALRDKCHYIGKAQTFIDD